MLNFSEAFVSRNAAGSCHGNKYRGRIFWNCFAGYPALCSKVRLAMVICTKAKGIGPGSPHRLAAQQGQGRAQPLATIEDRVAESLLEDLR